jgi:hypothetical protein
MNLRLAVIASCISMGGLLSGAAVADDPNGEFLAGDWTCTRCPDSNPPKTLTVKWQDGSLWFPTDKGFVKGTYDMVTHSVRLQSWADPDAASPGNVSDVAPLVIHWNNDTTWQKIK